MRKLLLSVMVLATLISCGKKAGAPAAVASVNGITVNDATAIQLGGLIDSSETSFGQGQSGYSGVKWNSLVNGTYYHLESLKYQYSSSTPAAASSAASANSGCSTGTWGPFGYGYCSPTMTSVTSTSAVTSSVLSSSVDLTAKRNELKGIANSAAIGSISHTGTLFIMTNTSTGVRYVIDTSFPLQANPVLVQQANGQVTALVNII